VSGEFGDPVQGHQADQYIWRSPPGHVKLHPAPGMFQWHNPVTGCLKVADSPAPELSMSIVRDEKGQAKAEAGAHPAPAGGGDKSGAALDRGNGRPPQGPECGIGKYAPGVFSCPLKIASGDPSPFREGYFPFHCAGTGSGRCIEKCAGEATIKEFKSLWIMSGINLYVTTCAGKQDGYFSLQISFCLVIFRN